MATKIPKEYLTNKGLLKIDYAMKIATQIQQNQPHISQDRIPDLARHIVDSRDGLFETCFDKQARKKLDINMAIDWSISGQNGCDVDWSNVFISDQVPEHTRRGVYE